MSDSTNGPVPYPADPENGPSVHDIPEELRIEWEVKKEMIKDVQWYINYHSEKLMKYEIQLEIINKE